MSPERPSITGIGSVSPFGPLRGLVGRKKAEPRTVTAWPTDGLRRAFLVSPFRPAEVVPGLKTRRLDRLSVWCLVAAALAIEDARLDLKGKDLNGEDRSRIAVVFGTGFGCLELTEAFLQSVAANGYAGSDPIVFPETLTNAPAAHVARVFGLRGPNVTLSHKGLSGEGALMQAASLLRSGQAELAIVLAGDTLTRSIYDWFEAAALLSRAAFDPASVPAPFSPSGDGFVPGESVTAVVMESAPRARSRGAQVYAAYRSGFAAADPKAGAFVARRALGDSSPADVRMVISSANGSRTLDQIESAAIREVFGAETPVIAPKAFLGESDSVGILRLIAALSWTENSARPLAVLLGTSAAGGCAALSFELP
jgi:3-oxoacyl-[acyl-carrier-protein] synthase II